MLNSGTLFASLIWGSIGTGFAIYGKRQQDMISLGAGIALMIMSYFIGSALMMSIASIVVIAGVFLIKKVY